jgi:hypothetical protein
MKILFRMALLGIIVAAVVVLANIDPRAVAVTKRQVDVKRWMHANIASSDVELVGFSEARKLWNANYQVGWIRGKNTFGVTVITHYIFELGAKEELMQGWPSRDFLDLKRLELNEMSPSMQGQRALELQRFCKEMGIPIEKDA